MNCTCVEPRLAVDALVSAGLFSVSVSVSVLSSGLGLVKVVPINAILYAAIRLISGATQGITQTGRGAQSQGRRRHLLGAARKRWRHHLHPGAHGEVVHFPEQLSVGELRSTVFGVRRIAGRARLTDREAVGQLWRHRRDVEDSWVILSYLILYNTDCLQYSAFVVLLSNTCKFPFF